MAQEEQASQAEHAPERPDCAEAGVDAGPLASDRHGSGHQHARGRIGQGDAAPVQPEPVRQRGEREGGQRGFRQIDAGLNLHGAPP